MKDNEGMNVKKLWKKIKTNILLYTVIILVSFVISHFILKILSIKYRQWVYYAVILLFMIGIVVGAIQIIRKKGKTVKVISSIIGTIIAFFVIFYWQLFLLGFVFSYCPEHVIERDGKRYVAYVKSFLSVNVDYYDYINFFLVGDKVKIHEYYGKGGFDPFDGKHDDYEVQQVEYYNNDGKSKRTESSNKQINSTKDNTLNNNKVNEENMAINEVLYEKKIDDNISIRVVCLDYILAQRSIISIEKTINGGKNWTNQLEVEDGFIQIHNGAKFTFLDENIGFINDPGLVGTDGDNRGLLVTINGGKSFKEASINTNEASKNLYIDDVPFIENGMLKLKAHTIKNSKKEYYYFYSEDKGITWKQL